MGIVAEVGKEVKNFKAGDRVVVLFTIACGTCFFCQKELYSCCDTTNRDAKKAAEMMGTHRPGSLVTRISPGTTQAGRPNTCASHTPT